MRDTVSRGLDLLAAGLRPYIFRQATVDHRDERTRNSIESGDVQFLLVFMWDHWNDVFRHDLSFVERSLVSELRDFRNRWAHQESFTEHDVYRVLDNVERLLRAVKSDRLAAATDLRRESLDRLWQAEVGSLKPASRLQAFWPYLLCFTSAAALSLAFLRYLISPWDWILSILVTVGLLRLAWHQSRREAILTPGPRECSNCSRIVYTIECPYCHPETLNATHETDQTESKPLAFL
ncbi:MAG TPA: Swt1 family HEPN domain-containing protein [Planctomycetaceae bacterium]|nr:Swt1 family HEPN domain-containing protein [Planctomycetaceae bacterium]